MNERVALAINDSMRKEVIKLSKALLSLADTAGMPISYQQTDRRTKLARAMLDKYSK